MPLTSRPREWALYQPLVGSSMLELGNKKTGDKAYKPFFESLGYRHVSVDWNGRDGALKLDLRKPIDLGTFDMVTNIGTTEHVSEQAPVWRNICEAMHVGSVLISTTPIEGHWWWHGEWYPTEQFYRALADLNGLEIERLYVEFDYPHKMIFARMIRREARPFTMPDGLMYRNRIRPRNAH